MSYLRIVYPKQDGGVGVLIPALNNAINDDTGEWYPLRFIGEAMPEGFRLCRIEDIAAKDVPDYITYEPTGTFATEDEEGNPYPEGEAPELMEAVNHGQVFEIIEASQLPDRASRNAWEWV